MTSGEPSAEWHDEPLPPELAALLLADAGAGFSDDEACDEGFEDDDPLQGPSFGLPSFQQALLAVIDAHPVKSGLGRRERLDAAMKALGVGLKSADVPLPPDPRSGKFEPGWIERPALDWMALKWASIPGLKSQTPSWRWFTQLWNGGKEGTHSDLSLALQAADKFFPSCDQQYLHQTAKRLAAMFSGDSLKKRKGRDPALPSLMRHTHAYRAVRHDYLRETVEAQIARRICVELERAGVKVLLPD